MKVKPFFCAACTVATILLVGSVADAQQRDSFSVYFRTAEDILDARASHFLDSLTYYAGLKPGNPVQIIGYADYVGSNGYNDSLSLRRARGVKKYLLSIGFKDRDVKLLLACGEVVRAEENGRRGFAADRRVDIVVSRSFYPTPGSAGRKPKTDTIRRSAVVTSFETLPPRPKRIVRRDTLARKPVRKSVTVKEKIAIPAVTQPPTPVEDLLTLDSTATVRMNNLYFPPGRHTPYSSSFAELNRLFQMLKDHKSLRVRVEGHVCCINGNLVPDALDEETSEFNLSVNRAKFITEYLIRKGISPKRLEYAGFGKQRPIIPFELSNADGELNRRVEIRVLAR